MRRRLFALSLSLIALALPAGAQSPPPARPPAPIAAPPPAEALGFIPSKPASGPSLANGGLSNQLVSGFRPLGGYGGALKGLSPVADPVAQCRVGCAKTLNQCSDGKDQTCSDNWRQCVTRCRTTPAS